MALKECRIYDGPSVNTQKPQDPGHPIMDTTGADTTHPCALGITLPVRSGNDIYADNTLELDIQLLSSRATSPVRSGNGLFGRASQDNLPQLNADMKTHSTLLTGKCLLEENTLCDLWIENGDILLFSDNLENMVCDVDDNLRQEHPESHVWYPRPFIHHHAPKHVVTEYESVVAKRCVNREGARCTLKSGLNFEAWDAIQTGHESDKLVLDGIRYGFPLQYTGGPIYVDPDKNVNHHSGRAYPEAVEEYINKEVQLGALVGPFPDPPFKPWCNISPIMTRPKQDTTERRVIVDLSFPDGGVNKYIHKNVVDGEIVSHTLPTVKNAIDIIRDVGVHKAFLSCIDISRAYRNFRTCPSDWPLLVIKHNGQYFMDTAIPFGSRMSSWFVQNIAEFIMRALKQKGITSLIYLDDILLISDDAATAQHDYEAAQALLLSLGLPLAVRKLSPPSRDLIWLGIRFDLQNNMLAIPDKKLEEIRDVILQTKEKSMISVRHLQKLVGVINHIGKAVPPARLFMSRLLETLRASDKKSVQVDENILADIRWFKTYLRD